jgi:serine carboxypeptidase-like clade 2
VDSVGSPLCDPIGTREQTYLRRSDVQAAIHADESLAPAPWAACSSAINYDAVGAPMVPLYQQFQAQKPGFQVLILSGDVDIATVPFAVTLPCLAQIGSPNTRVWGPWFVNGGTAGYWAQYKHFTYATIKGAGHEAPQYVPLSSFYVVKRFIEQGSLHDLTPRKARKFVKRPLTQGQVLRSLLQDRARRGLPN